MEGMSFQKIISDLIEIGMTQEEIASAVGSGQTYISDLYRGRRTEPGYHLGLRLTQLHRRRKGRALKQIA
jgi:transcriptional regulator with XRE-family HTH domain